MVENFAEWCAAVSKESIKLREVEPYLTEDGKTRMAAFRTLVDLSEYAVDAADMESWIADTRHDLSDYEIEILKSEHLKPALRRLHQLATAESKS